MIFKPLLRVPALLLCALSLHAAPAAAHPAVIKLLDEAARLEPRDPAIAMVRTREALAVLDAQGAGADPDLRRRALVQRCWLQATDRLPETVRDTDAALASPLFAGWDARRAELRLCRAWALSMGQDLRQARREYEAVLSEAERLRDRALLADTLALRGEARYLDADYAPALADLQRAYDLNTELKRTDKLPFVLNSIANLYADPNVAAYDQAIRYYAQLLTADSAQGSLRTMATGLFNIAATYEQKKDYERALDFYARTMEIEAHLDLSLEHAYTQRARAATLIKMDRAQDALPLLDEALAVFERLDDADRAAQTRATRGKALRLLGRAREALVDLSRARAYFEQQDDHAFLEQIHEQRALSLEAVGDWRGAAQARAMQAEFVRSVADRLKARQLARLQVQFDTARKDEENAALFAENALRKQALDDAASIQRLQWLLIAVGGVAFIALGVMTWRQVHLSRRMRDLALSDELTRLPNRRNLLAQAQLRMDQARDDKTAMSILAIDIDHFKRINDLYGHEAGDLVLRRVAQACTSAMRSNDVIGRVGGEEFTAVLADADREVARAVGERMRAAVQALRFPDLSSELRVTISVGLAERAEHEHLFSPLAARADAALYRAKEAGRNRLEE